MLLSALLPSIGVFGVNSSPTPIKKEQRVTKKQLKKKARLEKRVKKLEKKLEKKGYAKGNSAWDNDTFRLGALIALGGLVVRLFAFLPFIGGIFSLLGTLILLVGLGIMIWVLIDG